MRCVLCKQGETQPGQVTVVLERAEKAIQNGAEVEILRFAA